MIISLEELLKILEKERKGKRVVFTNGCFDIIHAGHVDYLEKAKKLGDILIVGLNSDSSIRRIKGKKRPIIHQDMRAKVLSSLKPVDYVVIFEEDTPERLIKAIKPDVLVKGGDWELDKIVGRDFVESYGGKVLTIPFEYNISTTKIIQKIVEVYCTE
ncbi:MAG: D-glycero-beta-D-manno-heptose 1-phosphate adenylyltransferase [Aquifex sp.]|nr:MAG: D-glycero-beta-D-manno-heptose 1-phosphate adenylyltransferase [Aquifex sp.]